MNDYPFPYKIHIEVASADQSSIDVIKKVGGTVTIVYMERINLRAHVKPFKFEVLPRTARPNLDMIHFLEKMRSRGCLVKYIKPLWLIEEEKRIINEMTEVEESSKLCPEGEQQEGGDEEEQQRRERLLQGYRLQNASGGDQRVAVG